MTAKPAHGEDVNGAVPDDLVGHISGSYRRVSRLRHVH
jgi:hypothetical protein